MPVTVAGRVIQAVEDMGVAPADTLKSLETIESSELTSAREAPSLYFCVLNWKLSNWVIDQVYQASASAAAAPQESHNGYGRKGLAAPPPGRHARRARTGSDPGRRQKTGQAGGQGGP